MSKTIKLISALLIAVMLVTTLSTNVYAKDTKTSDASSILDSLDQETNISTADKDGVLKEKAGRLLSIIQYIGIIGGALVLAILGIKYMLGSVEEKAEYKKSFIPLIVGAIVVMGAVSIAKFLFGIFA